MEYEANISPKLKLQILSRDDFKCTNCAAGVPDIYLGVQSLYPGQPDENHPTNLRTLCVSCLNASQGRRITDPFSFIEERKAQLEQMLSEKYGDRMFFKQQTNEIIKYVNSLLCPDFLLDRTDTFRIERTVYRFGFITVLEVLEDAYYDKIKIKNGIITPESKILFVRAISAYSYISCLPRVERAQKYVVGGCRKHFGKSCESQVKARLRNYVDYLKKYAYNEDWIEHDLREDVSRHVWSYNRISIFEHWLLNHCKELILVKAPKRQ